MATEGTIYNTSTGLVRRLITNIAGITEANLNLGANEAFIEGHYEAKKYKFVGSTPTKLTPSEVPTPMKNTVITARGVAAAVVADAMTTIIEDVTQDQDIRDAFQAIRDQNEHIYVLD